jgi:hypothetical protein
MVPNWKVAATTYVQQRGSGDFTYPLGARPSLRNLVCPCCCRVRSAPVVGGGGRPQVVVLMLPSRSIGQVWYICCAPEGYRLWYCIHCLRLLLLSLAGLIVFTMVRQRWCLQDRGGVC